MKKRRVLSVSLLVAALLLIVSISGVQGAANPAVLPPTTRVQGLTLGDWGAEVFRALFAIPASQNPGLPGNPWPTCYLERIGNVGVGVAYFYSGSSECEMPVGMTLYVVVVGADCDTATPPTIGGNEEELRACVLQTARENLEASIDGIPVRNIEEYSALSPLFHFTVPGGNVLGVPAGTYNAVTYTTGFLVAPLSPGAHIIHVHGEVPSGSFIYDWVYHITVKN